MDFGLTVGGAGAVGTDGGAKRAVGFGGAGIATGGDERLIPRGGGAICRVADPPEILLGGKFNFERGIVRGGGANSPPRAPLATGAGRRAITGLVGISADFR